jgi:protein disulfide-isomerase
MRKPVPVLCAIAWVACLQTNITWSQAPVVQDEIYWANSPQMAQSHARDSRLPILAFFTSENCGFCRKMEHEVWSKRRIIAQVESEFIPLKVQAEQHRQFVQSVGIQAFPTTVLFTPEGKVIGGAPGFLSAAQVVSLMRTARPAQLAPQQLPPVR